MEQKRRPWIGFLGLLVMLTGCGMLVFSRETTMAGIAALAVGTVVLVWAIMTGNLKLFG